MKTALQSDVAFAAQLRGFGPIGIAAIAVILSGNLLFVPLSALLVLWWAHASRTPSPDLGFVKPRSGVVATVVMGVAIGVVLKLVMKAIVMPLLGAPAINPMYHYLAGNHAALPGMILLIVIGAGFGEEVVFRSFLFQRLRSAAPLPPAAIVVITSVLFGAAHYFDQGVPGVQQATIVGLIYGGMYAFTRSIWIVMVAHTAFDLTALAIIYWDVETEVARLIFG